MLAASWGTGGWGLGAGVEVETTSARGAALAPDTALARRCCRRCSPPPGLPGPGLCCTSGGGDLGWLTLGERGPGVRWSVRGAGLVWGARGRGGAGVGAGLGKGKAAHTSFSKHQGGYYALRLQPLDLWERHHHSIWHYAKASHLVPL